ncbi:MAG: PIN domain-containing protein [Candidatus Latescibacteria bacterium]|nr:PIN domain-containing protein [Candidatus Latescibacterota bacterium]
MTKRILADTCIWIEYFRTTSSLSEELRKLIREDRIVTTGLVILELLHGVKTSESKKLIKDAMLALAFLETTLDSWIMAGDTGYTFRRKGITLPATDLLLAAVAKVNNCSIFTIDSHFKVIPNIDLYSMS